MQKSDKVRLMHILDAAQEAVGFSQGRSREDIDTNRMLNLSLVRLIEIIGEATRGITQEFRETHPEVAWKEMAGMRDRLVHGYYDVNFDVVWETVINDLPLLIVQLESILASEKE